MGLRIQPIGVLGQGVLWVSSWGSVCDTSLARKRTACNDGVQLASAIVCK